MSFSPVYRVVMSAVVIAYLSVGWASHNRKSPVGKYIYKRLRGMQTTLCLWQNWGMFAPPPMSSSWIEFTGVTDDGQRIALEPLTQLADGDFFRWRYDRRNKLAMSALNAKRKALHRGIAQYYCAQQRDLGIELKRVKFVRHKRYAIRPFVARKANPPPRSEKTIEMGSFRCR